jgi:branched-chain amino acid transport system substrate-binding protein
MSVAGAVAPSRVAAPFRRTRMRSRRRSALGLVLAVAAVLAARPAAAQVIKIGEINTYSGIAAPFTGPYRQGVELALEELNARGGLLGGRKVGLLRAP